MYKPLSEYGLIGDCRSCALVNDQGSIEWACLPNFDSPAFFCQILDEKVGGFFKVAPVGAYQTHQKYKGNTNILKTYFFNQYGSVSLTDFMPLTKKQEEDSDIPENGLKFIRRATAIDGNHKIKLELKVTPNFAQNSAAINVTPDYTTITAGTETLVLYSRFRPYLEGEILTLDFDLKEGEDEYVGLAYFKNVTEIPSYPAQLFVDLYKRTENFWIWWASLCQYKGQFAPQVLRSALALKLLTYSPTGAIVAAATTSIPERLGGGLNWDYRYTWLRDASFTVYAFLGLGYIKEAQQFINWLEKVCLTEDSNLKIMYTIEGKKELEEQQLPNLEGYKQSSPVRIGNGASNQKQFDIFGEVLTGINLYVNSGGELNEAMQGFVGRLVDYCCVHWREKDAGIWEARGQDQHNTYSKLMCWVGIDRGIKIAQKFKMEVNLAKWQENKEMISQDILENGYDKDLGSFVAYYGSKDLDTSTLNIPIYGFLPVTDPRVLSTIDQVMNKLVVDWFVLRSSDEKNELLQGEGTFFLSTFWLIDCLSLLGRTDEAQVWLEKMIHVATPLGLYAEQFDPQTKEHLGNYPQAFTHLGFINSVLNLYQAQMLKPNEQSTPADRLQKIINTFFNPNGAKGLSQYANLFALIPLIWKGH